VFVAEELEDEHGDRRASAALSVAFDLALRRDAAGLQQRAELRAGLEGPRLRVQELRPFQVDGAGDVAGPRVVDGLCALVLAGAADVPEDRVRLAVDAAGVV